mmetsp:Transcript_14436/g.31073  ORF Transcript_14436/g.31073 Transcript_14436/m.31073 type:complete len:265 (+) Transcript_14436:1050-1844(+)
MYLCLREARIDTSSYMAASSLGGISLRRTHLIATFLPVALCVPLQTVAKDPDLSCMYGACATTNAHIKKRGIQYETFARIMHGDICENSAYIEMNYAQGQSVSTTQTSTCYRYARPPHRNIFRSAPKYTQIEQISTHPCIELINFPKLPPLATLGELGHLTTDDSLLNVQSHLIEYLLHQCQALLVCTASGIFDLADGIPPPKINHQFRSTPCSHAVFVDIRIIGEKVHINSVRDAVSALAAINAGGGHFIHLDGLAGDAKLEC